MATKRFFFDFYQCTTISSNDQQAVSASDVFNQLLVRFQAGPGNTVKRIGLKLTELRHIEQTPYGFKGILGKHRVNDLPHAAIAGGIEREITLQDNENLLEKAYFNFYTQNNVLIIQRNRYCYNWLHVGKYLTDGTQTTSIDPIIEPTSLAWLMQNDVHIKTLEISIARPRNVELFQNVHHNFNNALIATLNGTNSAKVNLTLRGDARAEAPENRYLGSSLKRAFTETLETFEVEKLKLDTKNVVTGVEHPIDLVSEKLTHFKDLQMMGRYPLSENIWEALLEAKASKDDELNAYFGLAGQQVR